MTDGDRIREFLDTIAHALDVLAGPAAPGPTVEDVINDPDFDALDLIHSGYNIRSLMDLSYATGWLRGAAEALDVTVLQMIWEHVPDEHLSAWPRRAPFQPRTGDRP